MIPSRVPSCILVTIEDDSQEDYGEDLDLEVTWSSKVKKVGQKTNRNRREKDATREKELGIQTTLEEVFKKDGKSRKAPPTKGHSHPSKGGASKSSSK